MNALMTLALLGQIVVPAESENHAPITATISAPIPAGAEVKGSWDLGEGVRSLPGCEPNSIYVWARPGKHVLKYTGYWVLTEPVTFKDGDGNERTINSFLRSGFVSEQSPFTVLGGADPDPPKPPPGGKYNVIFFAVMDELDKMSKEHQHLLNSRKVRTDLARLGHHFAGTVDDDQIHQGDLDKSWKPWIDAILGDPLPRVAISLKDRKGPVRDFPLPKDYAELLKLLEGNNGTR